jgi:hypothetical protein
MANVLALDVFWFCCSQYVQALAIVHVKARGRGGWRHLDTGQVLIESACTVERTEEALDALLPLVDGIRYFRFNPGGQVHSNPTLFKG